MIDLLLAAMQKGCKHSFGFLISQNFFNRNYATKFGLAFLHIIAAEDDKPQFLQRALECAVPDTELLVDHFGNHPLHYAVWNGGKESVKRIHERIPPGPQE